MSITPEMQEQLRARSRILDGTKSSVLLDAAAPKPTLSDDHMLGRPYGQEMASAEERHRQAENGIPRLKEIAAPKPALDASCGHCSRSSDCTKTANPSECALNTNHITPTPQPGEVEEAVEAAESYIRSGGKGYVIPGQLRTILSALADLRAQVAAKEQRDRSNMKYNADSVAGFLRQIAKLRSGVVEKDAEIAKLRKQLKSHLALDNAAAELQATINEFG